jgi:hypothetical protein
MPIGKNSRDKHAATVANPIAPFLVYEGNNAASHLRHIGRVYLGIGPQLNILVSGYLTNLQDNQSAERNEVAPTDRG